MNAIQYEDTFALPGRPRRRFWGPGTAALIAVLVGAIGFYAGIRVEKGQVSGSATGAGLGLGPGGRAGAGGGTAGAGATGAGTNGSGAAGSGAAGSGAAAAARSGFGGGGGAGGFRALAAGGAGGGNSSFGTVSTVNGKTLYVTDLTGNTIKVSLSSATKISKSVGVGKSAVRPGDTVIVQGLKGSGGSVQATSVSDTGARSGSSSAGSSGSSSAGSGSSGSSAVGSLFGSG